MTDQFADINKHIATKKEMKTALETLLKSSRANSKGVTIKNNVGKMVKIEMCGELVKALLCIHNGDKFMIACVDAYQPFNRPSLPDIENSPKKALGVAKRSGTNEPNREGVQEREKDMPSKIEENNLQISTLQQQNKDNLNLIDNLKEQLKSAKATINRLEREIDDKRNSIKTASTEEQNTLKSNNSELKDQVWDLETNQSLKEQVAKLDQSRAELASGKNQTGSDQPSLVSKMPTPPPAATLRDNTEQEHATPDQEAYDLNSGNRLENVEENKEQVQTSKPKNGMNELRIKELEGNLESLEQANKIFKADVERLEIEKKEITEESEKLESQVNSIKQENERKNEEMGKLLSACEEEKEKSQVRITEVERERDEGKKQISKLKEKHIKNDLIQEFKDSFAGTELIKDEVIRNLIAKNQENIDRLASEMNAKIASDESALENISIKCRPMNVAEDYNLLCSNAWLEAKGALDDKNVEEDVAAKYLCEVLMVSRKVAEERYHALQDEVFAVLTKPLAKPVDVKKSSPLPQGVATQISDYLRMHITEIEVDQLVKDVKSALENNFDDAKTCAELPLVTIYIKESVRLAWKMVIQRPAMEYAREGEGNVFKSDDRVDLAWGSAPKDGAKLCYYVSPILFHAGKVMAKGKVVVK